MYAFIFGLLNLINCININIFSYIFLLHEIYIIHTYYS